MAERQIDRRTFIKGGVLAGGALLGGGAAIAAIAKEVAEPAAPAHSARKRTQRQGRQPAGTTAQQASPPPRQTGGTGASGPNILVIVVDQLRAPQWFTASPTLARMLPNISRLRSEGVSFERHYTASNDCTPARATLLTGLYTHQTGCMITGGSTLDPGFPTWGTMLREHGYGTWWFGKWHLTHGDNHWRLPLDAGSLEPYGFSGGTYPSPDGGPGQGWRMDPQIAGQFEQWFAENGESREPWCTTVSFVNPHDIAWWHKWTARIPAESSAPALVRGLPPNYETPEMLEAHNKPLLQLSLQQTAARSFGPVPFTGPDVPAVWTPFLDLYVKLQRTVDAHVGRVLRTLESRPEVAANTIVVFTSDHGEYGASHGLRGKGGGAYEEAVRVPLIVKDPRGALTAATARPRTQLTSSVDVAPLLLSVASGSNAWRRERRYAHLAHRADLAAILAYPARAGAPVRAARDRRDRHGVRRPNCTRRTRRCTWWRCARPPRSTRRTPTGAKTGSSPCRKVRSASSTTTARARAAWSCTTSRPLEARPPAAWSTPCTGCSSGRCARSCAARFRATCTMRRGWAFRTTC